MAYTKQNARVKQFTVLTTFDGSDGATAVDCHAYLENRLTEGADTVMRGIPCVSFDLLNLPPGTTFSAAGKNVNGPQLAALIRQACLDMANAQGVS